MSPSPVLPHAALWWLLAGGQLFLAAIFAWFRFKKKPGTAFRWAPEFLVFELVTVAIGFDLLPRLVGGVAFPLPWLMALISNRVVWSVGLGNYWPEFPDRGRGGKQWIA